MSINLIKRADVRNISNYTGLPQTTATRSELKQLVGVEDGSGLVVPSLHYFGMEALLNKPFFCKDCSVTVSNGDDDYAELYCSILRQSTEYWESLAVTKTDFGFYIDFNDVLPDYAKLIYKIQFTYLNLSVSPSTLQIIELLSVDYPINFDFNEFSVVASSHENSPLKIYNNSVQGTERDVRVFPIYSGDFALDQVFMLTESGKEDTDKYHINRGISIPDSIPWSSGYFENTTTSGRFLTLSGTSTSGSWTSPVIFTNNEDYITMYLYSNNTNENAVVERDWTSVNELIEARGSNETPLPHFLILSWNKELFSMIDGYGNLMADSLPTPDRRPVDMSAASPPDPSDPYWLVDDFFGPCGNKVSFVSPCPYIFGKSKRIFMKGDGTVIHQSEDGFYEMASRVYWVGIPYKIYGDINDYWTAGLYNNLLGAGDYGGCTLSLAQAGMHDRMTIGKEGSLTADWLYGRSIKDYGISNIYPNKGYCLKQNIGVAQELKPYEYFGATTLAMKRHPNEWAVVSSDIYPIDGGDRFINVYLLNIRNWWVSERQYLGSFSMGGDACDEGYAVCKSEFADDNEGGFWLHVGYSNNIIRKYSMDGRLLADYEVKRGYSYLIESKVEGELWAVRNTGIYYYKEVGDELEVQFKIEDDRFDYLHLGGIDDDNNLWVVDRDTSTIYRINFSSREIDYSNYVPYVIGVWPHPSDGSAYLYVSFYPDTFTTAIKRVWVNDPYQYEELITPVNSMPLSDSTGVQFKGKVSGNYISVGSNDPIWGNNGDLTLEWQSYANASLTLPTGKYKQFRITLRRSSSGVTTPNIQKIRIPLPLILEQVPFEDYKNVYINPHLRYDRQRGHYTTELVSWWHHDV